MPEQDKVFVDSHNLNCFAYLHKLGEGMPGNFATRLFEVLKETGFPIQEIQKLGEYDKTYSYANLYTQLLSHLESHIEGFEAAFKGEFERYWRDWFNQVYANKNDILPATYGRFKESLQHRTLQDARPEKRVKRALEDGTTRQAKHRYTPEGEGSGVGRFAAMLADNFKPMLTTSLPSTRDYGYTTDDHGAHDRAVAQELRFGTQAQRHDGVERVSPLFRTWLRSTADSVVPDKVTHIYFNLLGYDRTGFEGGKERRLSLALHQLEEKHPNIMVITLPADKGLMDKDAYKKMKTGRLITTSFEDMRQIASGESTRKIKDFVISEAAKKKLYGESGGSYNKKEEQRILEALLDNSFRAMGIEPRAPGLLSKAQEQAVWFHFCKYEMPNFILEKIKPKTWNASCKDAIDRGGVASAYKNLLSSFKTARPMSRDEFEQALHAAAALVKGRGLNHHYEIIWNAVHHYVEANFETLAKNPNQAWLIHWRNDNAPHALVKSSDYIGTVIERNKRVLALQLKGMDDPNDPRRQLIEKTQAVIEKVEQTLFHDDGRPKNVSGKRLLLEVVSQSTQLALHPDQPKNIAPLLDQLDKQKFKPLCKVIKLLIDFAAVRFDWAKKLRSKDVYASLSRHGDDRESVAALRRLDQEMKQQIESARPRSDTEDESLSVSPRVPHGRV